MVWNLKEENERNKWRDMEMGLKKIMVFVIHFRP